MSVLAQVRGRRSRTIGSALVTMALIGGTSVAAASAQASPGTPGTAADASASPAATGGINPVVTETGKITVSTDGLGTNNASGGSIQVQKPAGATVRGAYLGAASTGFSQRTLVNGDVKLAGSAVSFSTVIPNGIFSSNGFANVTSIVKPVVDAAPAGIVNLHVDEVATFGIDGEALAVIFNDPSQAVSNTVALLFGAQQTTGDTFAIGFANPINKSDPNLKLNMALGISFGFQPSGQFSQIDVNGQRLTTSAGGQDDCPTAESCINGALLTMGGIGDSNANPPNPTATDITCGPPAAPRCDDELYNLLPFVQTGDTSIDVATVNPSNDDNIFFGAFTLNSTTAVVGEGILLSPASATNQVGQPHTLTATVQDDSGNPIINRAVTFKVLSGPRAGLTGTANTNAQGKATFTYTSNVVGTDTIQASFKNSQNVTVNSNTVTKTWSSGNSPTTCVVTALRAGPPQQQDVTVKDLDGIASIFNVNVINGTVNVPAFTPGTTGPVVLTATKTNQSQRTFWEFDVKDSKGVTTHCV
jgi:hypothetical protein